MEVLFKTSLPSLMTDHKIFQEVRGLKDEKWRQSRLKKMEETPKTLNFSEIDSDSSFKLTK